MTRMTTQAPRAFLEMRPRSAPDIDCIVIAGIEGDADYPTETVCEMTWGDVLPEHFVTVTVSLPELQQLITNAMIAQAAMASDPA